VFGIIAAGALIAGVAATLMVSSVSRVLERLLQQQQQQEESLNN
jgi:hypothetical protein